SSWYGRRYDGAVRTAGDSCAIGHDAAFGRHDANGKHAGLAAVPHEGGQSDAAFRRFFPGCVIAAPTSQSYGLRFCPRRSSALFTSRSLCAASAAWSLEAERTRLNLRSESTWGILPTPRVLPSPKRCRCAAPRDFSPVYVRFVSCVTRPL